jgi:dTDP-4-amino-4,6-dideoxygalactose transaminase
MQARRGEIAMRYTQAFDAMDEVEAAHRRDGVTHAWHLYPLRLNLDRLTIERDRFIDEMTTRRIGCSLHFIPLHLFTYFRERYGYRPEDFPVATREFHRLVSLPLYPAMTDDDVDAVIEAVREIVTAHRR